MSTTFFFLRFLAIVGTVLALLHYYLWRRLVQNPQWDVGFRRLGTGLILALFLSLPLSGLLARLVSFRTSSPFSWLAYLWLGMLALFFFLFVFTDFLKFVAWLGRLCVPKGQLQLDPSRRRFLARGFAVSASVLVVGVSALGVQQGIAQPVVKRVGITLAGLPNRFKGFKIVQLSDVHIGKMTTAAGLTRLVAEVNQLQPDLVAITGDLVDGDIKLLAKELAPLAGLKAKEGVFFVTGNHEYYSGVEDWLPEIQRLGVQVLENRRVAIRRGEDSLILAGVNDHRAGTFGYAPDFDRALGGIEAGKKVILLAHQPIAVLRASAYTVDLVLAGHTHGGQIWPFHYLVYLQQPYLKGLYQHEDMLLYVNQGTACWGPPLRVGSTNEITELILS
jgi:predicted MPP superfamily phosphohydrolase